MSDGAILWRLRKITPAFSVALGIVSAFFKARIVEAGIAKPTSIRHHP